MQSERTVEGGDKKDYWCHYEARLTSVVWGCGHTADVRLALNPILAAEQLAAYTQIDCLPCAKAKKLSSSSINDVGTRR